MSNLTLLAMGLVAACGLAAGFKFLNSMYKRDTSSAIRTVRNHLDAGKKALVVLVIALGLLGLVSLAPPEWSGWIVVLVGVPFVLLNLSLPYLAGVCGSLGDFLSKPRRYQELQDKIDQLTQLQDLVEREMRDDT